MDHEALVEGEGPEIVDQCFKIFAPMEIRYDLQSRVLWVNSPSRNVVRIKLPTDAIVDFDEEAPRFDIVVPDRMKTFFDQVLAEITKAIGLVNTKLSQCKVVHLHSDDPVHTLRECLDMMKIYVQVLTARKEHEARKRALMDVIRILARARMDIHD